MQEGVTQDPALIEKSLHEILSERQFSHLAPAPEGGGFSQAIVDFINSVLNSPWMKSILSFIGKILAPILSTIEKIAGLLWNISILYIVVAVILLLMLLMIIHIYRTIRKNVIREVEKPLLSRSAPKEKALLKLESEARENAGRQDYLRAMQDLYLALLYNLDEKHVVVLNQALTNHEIADSLLKKHDDEASGIMQEINSIFETSYYAGRSATEEDYKSFNSRYQRLKEKL